MVFSPSVKVDIAPQLSFFLIDTVIVEYMRLVMARICFKAHIFNEFLSSMLFRLSKMITSRRTASVDRYMHPHYSAEIYLTIISSASEVRPPRGFFAMVDWNK